MSTTIKTSAVKLVNGEQPVAPFRLGPGQPLLGTYIEMGDEVAWKTAEGKVLTGEVEDIPEKGKLQVYIYEEETT